MSDLELNADARGMAEMDALIGRTVGGRFLITGRIARGGMACVYAAKQTQVNRSVAIKVLRSSIVNGGDAVEFRRRFLQEAAILSQLQHPNLVTLLDYGQIIELPGDHYFIAMEHLNGETLAKRLRTRGRLGVAQSIRTARQIGRGLREAHRHGFVHRDLKPSNIMLVPEDDEGDIVKLIDFGIGKAVDGASRVPDDEEEMTRVGLLLGSPRYMSPEQIRGEAIEPRTDLYGLGIILFQALTGRLPFEQKSEVDTMMAHCNTPAPPLDAYVDEPTGSLPELVAALLEKRAVDRPTIHEFLARLASAEAELFDTMGLAGPTTRPSVPPRPLSDSIRPPPPPPRPPSPGRLESEPPSLQELGDRVRALHEPPPAITAAALPADLPSSIPPSGPPTLSLAGTGTKAPARRPAWIGVAVLLGIAAGIAWWSSRAPAPSAILAPPTPVAQVAPEAFVLRLDSVPSQAVVKEADTVLGRTPLRVELQRASLQAEPRRFVVEREGFVPATHVQVDSTVDVEAVVTLAPDVTAPSAPTPTRGRKRPVTAGVAVAPESAPPPSRSTERLDINLAR